MPEQAESVAVTKTVTVQAPPKRAFEVFTGEMSRWWPLATHHVGAQPAEAAVVEPHEGGRWFERAADGTECDWGRVLAWEPPNRVVLTFEMSPEWKHDPAYPTEVEVRFVPEGEAATRVELEHRRLDLYGEKSAEMAEAYGGDGGWSGILDAYAAEVMPA
jgi:uncharacterized protein YndB with AHSA1/START domain